MPRAPTNTTTGMLSDDFYPMTIRESRYGIYEGGPYVLIAGVYEPRQTTDAFAGDVPCGQFWDRVEADGPVIDVDLPDEHPDSEATIYAASGPHPTALFEEFEEFKQSVDRNHDNEIINEVFATHPELVAAAHDGDDSARHKLAGLAAANAETALEWVSGRIANRVIEERFNGDTTTSTDLNDPVREEVRAFIEAETDGVVPMRYEDLSKYFADDE